jgi:hypothetical protein
MNLHKALFVSLALLVPTTALAAIDDDGEGGGGGGGETTNAPPVQSKSYKRIDYWGLSNWGAGYDINGKVWAQPAYDDFKDRLGVRGSAEAYTRLNGSRYSLFRAVAAGSTEAKKKTEASFNAYVAGANIYTKSWTSQTSTKVLFNDTKGWSKTFFDKRLPVDVIGIPVEFRAQATGGLMVSTSGSLSNVGVEAGATPQGYAGLFLSAAVGGDYCVAGICVGATAGVYSDLKLLSLKAPAKASTWWSLAPLGGVNVFYQATSDLSISSLDGVEGVTASACLGGCIDKKLELFDWTGFTKTISIANYSGSFCLAGNCSTPTNAPE